MSFDSCRSQAKLIAPGNSELQNSIQRPINIIKTVKTTNIVQPTQTPMSQKTHPEIIVLDNKNQQKQAGTNQYKNVSNIQSLARHGTHQSSPSSNTHQTFPHTVSTSKSFNERVFKDNIKAPPSTKAAPNSIFGQQQASIGIHRPPIFSTTNFTSTPAVFSVPSVSIDRTPSKSLNLTKDAAVVWSSSPQIQKQQKKLSLQKIPASNGNISHSSANLLSLSRNLRPQQQKQSNKIQALRLTTQPVSHSIPTLPISTTLSNMTSAHCKPQQTTQMYSMASKNYPSISTAPSTTSFQITSQNDHERSLAYANAKFQELKEFWNSLDISRTRGSLPENRDSTAAITSTSSQQPYHFPPTSSSASMHRIKKPDGQGEQSALHLKLHQPSQPPIGTTAANMIRMVGQNMDTAIPQTSNAGAASLAAAMPLLGGNTEQLATNILLQLHQQALQQGNPTFIANLFNALRSPEKHQHLFDNNSK